MVLKTRDGKFPLSQKARGVIYEGGCVVTSKVSAALSPPAGGDGGRLRAGVPQGRGEHHPGHARPRARAQAPRGGGLFA